MKKITLFLAAAMVAATSWAQNPTITTEWTLSAASSTLPTYIGTASSVRGMGTGTFEGEKVVVIPSREGGINVRVLKAVDGTQLASLNVTGIAGGLFTVSDAGVTEDGKILVSNMSNSNNNADHPFKVYMWANSTSAPTVAISYVLPGAFRFGDHVTIKGRIDDGTAKVYAVSGALVDTKVAILRFDMVSDGNGGFVFNQTPVNITPTSISAAGGYASIDFLPNGSFINKYNGSNMMRYAADGSFITGQSSSSGVVATGGNSVRYIKTIADTAYVAYFRYGAGHEKADILKLENGDLTKAIVIGTTPSLGANANGNGAGRVAVEVTGTNDDYIYVFSSNNGIGKYKITWPSVPTAVKNTSSEYSLVKSNNQLSVEGIIPTSIIVYNVAGQKLQAVANSNTISVEGLKGIHIVKMNVNGKTHTQKVVL